MTDTFNVTGDPIRLRTERELLVSVNSLLEELLAEVKRQNSTERTGAVSSLCFEDMTKGDPKCTTKIYAGSPLAKEDVDQALELHGYAHRRAAEMALTGWAETIAAVTEHKEEPWRQLVRVDPA